MHDKVSLLRSLRSRFRHAEKLEISWLTSDLAVSRAPFSYEWPLLERSGIRSVLDVREASVQGEPPEAETMTYFRIPIEEYGAPTLEAIEHATEWVAARIVEGPVLIHCREGIGRSPLIACASLVRLGLPLADAFEILHRGRGRVIFS